MTLHEVTHYGSGFESRPRGESAKLLAYRLKCDCNAQVFTAITNHPGNGAWATAVPQNEN